MRTEDRGLDQQTLLELHFMFLRYPHGRGECQSASRRAASRLGLAYIEGLFQLDTPLPGRRSTQEPHAWNLAEDGTIVDLTAEQFNPGMANAQEHVSGIAILTPDDPRYSRYLLSS